MKFMWKWLPLKEGLTGSDSTSTNPFQLCLSMIMGVEGVGGALLNMDSSDSQYDSTTDFRFGRPAMFNSYVQEAMSARLVPRRRMDIRKFQVMKRF